MSDYTKTTDFEIKDGLTTGDPNKLVLGAELETEFDNLASAISSKLDVSDYDVSLGIPRLNGSGLLSDTKIDMANLITNHLLAERDGSLQASLNADLLDGQEGTYYRDAANLNAGLISLDRIPTELTGKNAPTCTLADDSTEWGGATYTVDTAGPSGTPATGTFWFKREA